MTLPSSPFCSHGGFPDDIPPEHVSEAAFLWATQLWYSYGMEVGHLCLIKKCISPSAYIHHLSAGCAMSGVALFSVRCAGQTC